jgi:hypothetical protein
LQKKEVPTNHKNSSTIPLNFFIFVQIKVI